VHTYGGMKKVWGEEGSVIILNNNDNDQKDEHAQTIV
jgi:hypothetical protein